MIAPAIGISDAAKKAFLDASTHDEDKADGDSLRLTISPRFEPGLFIGPKEVGDMAIDCDGVVVLLDPQSAARANGVFIDYLDGPGGSGFKIENPNQPGSRKPIVLSRDCDAMLVPSGEQVRLAQGERVVLNQALGGTFTVMTDKGHMARIAAHNADALGFNAKQPINEEVESGPFNIDRVFEQLRTVFDPEIPVNVVDLGLIYACEAHTLSSGGQRVEIKMTLTAPGCGMGNVLKEEARARVQAVPGVEVVHVEIVLDPPWNQSRLSDVARLELGLL